MQSISDRSAGTRTNNYTSTIFSVLVNTPGLHHVLSVLSQQRRTPDIAMPVIASGHACNLPRLDLPADQRATDELNEMNLMHVRSWRDVALRQWPKEGTFNAPACAGPMCGIGIMVSPSLAAVVVGRRVGRSDNRH